MTSKIRSQPRAPSHVLLTSAAAAKALGVAVSTLKRWADDGRIPHVRTAGGHRRFRPEDLQIPAPSAPDSEAQAWITLLLSDADSHTVLGELRRLRGSAGSWREASQRLAAATRLLGERWALGQLSIHEEHQATEKLARGVAHCSDALPLAPDAPVCLLAVPEHEEHSLGLTLLEPCLRELGWRTRWLGRKTPAAEVVAVVRTGHVQAVALSASAHCRDAEALAVVTATVGEVCREFGIPLLLGGTGAWPLTSPLAHRLTSLAELGPALAGR